MVTYDNGEEEEEDDLDSEEERGAEMAVDDDTPWVEPPLVGSDGDPFSAGEPGTSTRGAEIDRCGTCSLSSSHRPNDTELGN